MPRRESLDQLAQFDDLTRIEPIGRFIEDQQRRIIDEGLCNQNPLAVAMRELADREALYASQIERRNHRLERRR